MLSSSWPVCWLSPPSFCDSEAKAGNTHLHSDPDSTGICEHSVADWRRWWAYIKNQNISLKKNGLLQIIFEWQKLVVLDFQGNVELKLNEVALNSTWICHFVGLIKTT